MTDNKLTLIILTYNRYSYLKRLIKFYNFLECKFNILVLDSSSDSLNDKDLILMLNSENIVWKKFNSKIFFAKKISEASKFISTDFSVLCADDDIIFPEGLRRSMNFLEENRDFSSCFGITYKHFIKNFFGKKILHFEKKNINYEFLEKSSYARVEKYLSQNSNYYPMYSVHRSEDFKRIWNITANHIIFWGLSEVFPCCLSLSMGKMKILNKPYTSRERNNFSWQNNQIQKEMYSLDKIELVKKILAEFLADKEKNSYDENLKFTHEVFNSFLNKLNQKKKYKVDTVFYKLKFLIKRFIKFYILGWNSKIKDLDSKTNLYLNEAIKDEKVNYIEIEKSRKTYDLK